MPENASIAMRCIAQPETLKTETYRAWSRGRGVDVWAMLYAAATGDLATIKALVAREPALLTCEYEYFKPLMFAVRENQRAVVDWLLEQGANPAEEAGAPLVTVARDRGYTELAALLESELQKRYHVAPEGTMMAAAIKAFDMPQVRALIDAHPQWVHAADGGGNQPIHWASLTRQIPLIDYLLERGADINARRADGARPLDLTNGDYDYRSWYRDLPPTALQKHEVLVGYLMAKGAYCDISIAAKMGYLTRVRELLDEDPSLANRIPAYDGYYSGLPLRCAASAGHIEVVKLLLERGANPNEPEPGIAPDGGALHAAIGARQYAVAKLLLEHGANPNAAVESSGNCSLMAKHVGAPKEFMDLLASYGGVWTTELICYDGNVQLLGAMLYANPKLEIGFGIGNLISEGHRQCMELLLRCQPDALKKGALSGMAWWSSVNPKDPDYTRWLVSRGLDLTTANWMGTTLLHRCAGKGNMEIAALCLEYGADINTLEGLHSSTPLGWAAREGKKDMVEWLLAQGADPRLPTEEPWAQPLSYAQRRGHTDIIELLDTRK